MLTIFLNVLQTLSEAEGEIFTQIYLEHQELMNKIICKYLSNTYDREDAVQDTLLSIARNIHKLADAPAHSVKLYVVKAAKSCAINICRKNSKNAHFPPIGDVADVGTDLLEDLAEGELVAKIVAFIKAMPAQYIDPLTLYIVLELSPGEISVALERPLNTVRSQLRRGQSMLREKFAEVIVE